VCTGASLSSRRLGAHRAETGERHDRAGSSAYLDDVIQLIRANTLPREFATMLDPRVRGKFDELWGHAQIPTDDY
jgi:hypothetical protein